MTDPFGAHHRDLEAKLLRDEYEVRTWDDWHRHITSHAFLAVVRAEEAKRGGHAGELISLTVPKMRLLFWRLWWARLARRRLTEARADVVSARGGLAPVVSPEADQGNRADLLWV